MLTGLDDRVAVVTGAAGGIGLATAQALADEGARVVAVDLSDAALASSSDRLPAGCLTLAADVSTPEGAYALVEAAITRFGRLDVLVAAAGVYETSSLPDADVVAWDRVQQVNLRGPFLCAQAAIPAMARGGWGRIVTVSSTAAFTGGSVSAGAAYVASKAGVMGLTRSLAHHAGAHGITVNCVNPGMIDTPMISRWDAATRDAVVQQAALRRCGRPEEVAAMIVMLASEGASFVTGAHLTIAGGLVMD